MSTSDCMAIVKTLLEDGTWDNYTDGPPDVFILYRNQVVGGNQYITLEGSLRDPIFALNCSVIYTGKDCVLKAFAVNVSNKNNIYTDILAILKASNYSFNVSRVKDVPNSIQREIVSMNIHLLN